MQSCYLKFNIHSDCDFGLYEFNKLANISISEFNDKDRLNNKLKKDVKNNSIQIGDIEYTKEKMVINVNINPI